MAVLLDALIQVKVTVIAFSMSLINKFLLAFLTLIIFSVSSCSGSKNSSSDTPSWYISPKQNNAENLYGVAQAFDLEEATKAALADGAARLSVSISATSTSLSEESKFDINEETRRQIKQNIEKIDFANFQVSRSNKIGPNYFVEVEIPRSPFVRGQKERIIFLEKKVDDLEKSLGSANPIQKRLSLLKIIDFTKQAELSGRILNGAGENIDLREKLSRLAKFENQLNNINDKIEFYFEINSEKEISQIIKNALNKEHIAISQSRNSSSNQVIIEIKSSSRSNKIYGAYITKLHIDFGNITNGQTVASNSVEVTGSSTISEKESYLSAVKSLEDKITKEGILKTIGIIN